MSIEETVKEFITQEFSNGGVEYESEGENILWFTPSPLLRDVGDILTTLMNHPNVMTIDQITDRGTVKFKIYLTNDGKKQLSVPKIHYPFIFSIMVIGLIAYYYKVILEYYLDKVYQ